MMDFFSEIVTFFWMLIILTKKQGPKYKTDILFSLLLLEYMVIIRNNFESNGPFSSILSHIYIIYKAVSLSLAELLMKPNTCKKIFNVLNYYWYSPISPPKMKLQQADKLDRKWNDMWYNTWWMGRATTNERIQIRYRI